MDEHTDDDDDIDIPINEKVDMYQMVQHNINTLSIDNIVEELEVLKRLLLHISSKKDTILSFALLLIQKINSLAIQTRGFVSFIADQIEDNMYEIFIEAHYNGMDQLHLRDPPLPISNPVENKDTYHVEEHPIQEHLIEEYPIQEYPVKEKQVKQYPIEIETNTTIPAITIMDTSFRQLQQFIPEITETNTTIPGIDITTSTFVCEENKQTDPLLQHNMSQSVSQYNHSTLPPPIPKKIMIPIPSPQKKQKKKVRQKSPVPPHKKVKRNESHKSKQKK